MSSQYEDNEFLDEYEEDVVSPNQPIQGQANEVVRERMSQENKIIDVTEQVNESTQQQVNQKSAFADAKQPLVWKISDMTSDGSPRAFNIYNAFMQNNPYQYTLYGEVVANRWEENFQYILGPTNLAFVDATLSDRDIAWGYSLEYNPNGILWRVSAAGIPHPDDYDNFIEQNRVIESTNNQTITEGQGSSAKQEVDSQISSEDSNGSDGRGVGSIPTTSDPVVSLSSTEASDPKKRIGSYYQEKGIFYKVTANGPQQVGLSEVMHQRVWAVAEDGTEGWWTVDERGDINWAGVTGEIRVIGDALWQIGTNGKDNYKGVSRRDRFRIFEQSNSGNMVPSDKLIDFIATYESFYDKPYRVTTNDPLTIGYGHVIQDGEDYSNGIIEEDAKRLLLQQITQEYAPRVNRWAGTNNVQLSQQQFDALVSFVYNLGDINDADTPTLARVVKSGNATPDEIKQAFGLYCVGADGPLPGLILRRRDEADMFLYGDYRRKP